ncbi:ABC transporter ATP-binding protein [Corynebacterium sp. 320]|uniref:ABC transporter ATP-binding protein n=1 Tax=Corynebacterium TaxID=1716 RepID=UPI00125CD0C0|nr:MULTISPECIES: ABC transporter ATP-binding protein [Corynebacterium]KAB1503878.1 ABC transporter ATP-binding protein [Corynebacterium sp. 320]KAB1553023.1 ABC transporter ATP-binding protein [Corynebacterium sp. 321]KAB1553757.1 ABC transporter ATP-binding protein [Corynebacterium sp. 319]KAB3528014.1 ABC transporter ATP-binding protein [Corynebacterium sp. 250]KAB3540497.1 ABC transporter ATP-binding protein [Corynebacterium sp. 366]
MSFSTNNVSWNRGGNLVVDGVTVEVRDGETLGLLGPNGSGKSSLIRLLAGFDRPTTGVVTLDERAVSRIPHKQLAQSVAVVTQHADSAVDVTVGDVVRLGRIPHRSRWGGQTDADHLAIHHAFTCTGLSGMENRLWNELSGGERQRAHIARALAQQPKELILDEPTNHLDIKHQLELLKLVSSLEATAIVALHDLNLAAMFCDRVLVLAQGSVVTLGTPAEALTSELIREVYGVDAVISTHPVHGCPLITFSA